MKNEWEVVVGNIGTVYKCSDASYAVEAYNDYVKISKNGKGRAAGESVTLLKNGEIHREHLGEEDFK